MKKRSRLLTKVLTVCLVFATVFCFTDMVSAKELTSLNQAEKLAKKKVKKATVTEVDKDYENGVLVYEVELTKGKKKYDCVYRASDSKLISYGWEIQSWFIEKGTGKTITKKKCKSLAKKQVSGCKITSVAKKVDDGIDVYKVKATKGNKEYDMEFHARTGKLLEYDWKITVKKSKKSNSYIGAEKAKQIALSKVGGGTVTKVELDKDDDVSVYEVEVIKGKHEYELEIDAKTGKILEVDMDHT